jgi:hypothetical protein
MMQLAIPSPLLGTLINSPIRARPYARSRTSYPRLHSHPHPIFRHPLCNLIDHQRRCFPKSAQYRPAQSAWLSLLGEYTRIGEKERTAAARPRHPVSASFLASAACSILLQADLPPRASCSPPAHPAPQPIRSARHSLVCLT